MIKSFRHKGIETFFLSGRYAGIQAAHASKLRRQLSALNEAPSPEAMNIPGWKLHPLKGKLKDHGAVWISGDWRLTFMFEGQDAVLVDYQDCH
jgi:proteic killer suppression protein